MNKNSKHRQAAHAAVFATVLVVGAHHADAAIVVNSYSSQVSGYAEVSGDTIYGTTAFHGGTEGSSGSLPSFGASVIEIQTNTDAPLVVAPVRASTFDQFIVLQDLAAAGSIAGSGTISLDVEADCVSTLCSRGYAEGHLRSNVTFTITDTSYNFDFTTGHYYNPATVEGSGEGIFSLTNTSAADTIYSSSWTASTNFSDGPSFHDSGLLVPGTYTFSWATNGTVTGRGADAASVMTADFRFELAPVPLPAAAWLLLSGLGGLAAVARRRRRAAGTA